MFWKTEQATQTNLVRRMYDSRPDCQLPLLRLHLVRHWAVDPVPDLPALHGQDEHEDEECSCLVIDQLRDLLHLGPEDRGEAGRQDEEDEEPLHGVGVDHPNCHPGAAVDPGGNYVGRDPHLERKVRHLKCLLFYLKLTPLAILFCGLDDQI